MEALLVLFSLSALHGAMVGALKYHWFAITITGPVLFTVIAIGLYNAGFWLSAIIGLSILCLTCNQLCYLLGLAWRYRRRPFIMAAEG